MLVITVETPVASYEIHMLNPHEHMEGFGGSRHGLLVGKTASLVVRTAYKNDQSVNDVEYDIHDPKIWELIGKWINNTTGQIKATTN